MLYNTVYISIYDKITTNRVKTLMNKSALSSGNIEKSTFDTEYTANDIQDFGLGYYFREKGIFEKDSLSLKSE